MTSWDEPYIGEESIRRPPSWKNARMTSAHESRAAASSPTLKVIQLPRPTSGSLSPVEGTGRVSSGGRAAAGSGRAARCEGRRTEVAPAAATDARRRRRVRDPVAGGRSRPVTAAATGWWNRPFHSFLEHLDHAHRVRLVTERGIEPPRPRVPVEHVERQQAMAEGARPLLSGGHQGAADASPLGACCRDDV